MPTEIVNTDDLREFKIELLNDIKELLVSSSTVNKKYLKGIELQKILNVSPTTLQTLRVNGILPYSKIGGTIFYDIDDVTKVMKENKFHHTY